MSLEDLNEDQLLEQMLIDGKIEHFNTIYSFKENPSEELLNREEVIRAKAHLMFAFNQFLAYEEHQCRYVFDEDYNNTLDSFTDWTLTKWFLDYMEGYREGVDESSDDPYLLTFNPPEDDDE